MSDIEVFKQGEYYLEARNCKGDVLAFVVNQNDKIGWRIYPGKSVYYTAATLKHLLEKVEELNATSD